MRLVLPQPIDVLAPSAPTSIVRGNHSNPRTPISCKPFQIPPKKCEELAEEKLVNVKVKSLMNCVARRHAGRTDVNALKITLGVLQDIISFLDANINPDATPVKEILKLVNGLMGKEK